MSNHDESTAKLESFSVPFSLAMKEIKDFISEIYDLQNYFIHTDDNKTEINRVVNTIHKEMHSFENTIAKLEGIKEYFTVRLNVQDVDELYL